MGQIFDAERQAEMQQNMWNFSANDDDDESNTVELTMFMLVRVSTMSGATAEYYWSGTLRSYCGEYVYSRTLKCWALNYWSGTRSM